MPQPGNSYADEDMNQLCGQLSRSFGIDARQDSMSPKRVGFESEASEVHDSEREHSLDLLPARTFTKRKPRRHSLSMHDNNATESKASSVKRRRVEEIAVPGALPMGSLGAMAPRLNPPCPCPGQRILRPVLTTCYGNVWNQKLGMPFTGGYGCQMQMPSAHCAATPSTTTTERYIIGACRRSCNTFKRE